MAIYEQYYLGNDQFSSRLSTIELTCLPQPEVALYQFESNEAAADLIYNLQLEPQIYLFDFDLNGFVLPRESKLILVVFRTLF